MTTRRRIQVDPDNPRAAGKCDRCDTVIFHDQLIAELAWRGDQLVPDGWLVCERCLDKPQPQDRSRTARRDPVPVVDPRPDDVVTVSITIWDGGASIWDLGLTFWDT